MTHKLTEIRTDHEGHPLPAGVYAVAREDGSIVGYKARWREDDDDGVRRNAAKRFSARKLGSLDRARAEARAYREAAVEIARRGEIVLRSEAAARMTVDDLFKEWLTEHAATNLSERYSTDAVRWWDREIGTRAIARVRLARLADDPALITRFQDELARARLTAASRVQVLKILRSVLRWGRQRYPRTLRVEVSGLFKLPSQQRRRLIYAADAVAVERLIEAVLVRRARDPLLPLRDAALVAAMGFTIAARPSEWLRSATWGDVYEDTVDFQRPEAPSPADDKPLEGGEPDEFEPGLKTGARVALLFPNARDRLRVYRSALEARHGAQPHYGLVFQALGANGPLWMEDGAPAAWSADDYKRWTARVWRPSRERAAKAADMPKGLSTMRFYDLRHTSISMALHSTLVMTRHGMDLHNLAAWAGHDVQTLQRRYSHIIARYRAAEPIDLAHEFAKARAHVEERPLMSSANLPGPQRAAQRRRRGRRASAALGRR
ncbi:MAG: hypothetical protein LC647_12965 [Beggiatoa sp.]|nr:hypothetical protein [Beggiatoa sp.]